MFRAGLLLLTCLISLVEASNLSPWFGNDKEFIADIGLESFYIKGIRSNSSRNQTNLIRQHFGLSISPIEQVNLDAILYTSRSSYRSVSFESFQASIQYQLTNDLNYDSFASSINIGFKAINGEAHKDPAIFYHSEAEAILSYSFGKEWSSIEQWQCRISTTPRVHLPIKGPVYYSFISQIDWRVMDYWILSFLIDGQLSHGDKPSIFNWGRFSEHRYHFLDVSFQVAYEFDTSGVISIFGTTQVKRSYCPKKTYSLGLQYQLPFGI